MKTERKKPADPKAPVERIVIQLLHIFIKIKTSLYHEPQRKGTIKGDPIGLSRKKYHAALLCLTNMSLDDVAGVAGVSYGVLKKWRTENAFRDAVSKAEREFISSVHVDL